MLAGRHLSVQRHGKLEAPRRLTGIVTDTEVVITGVREFVASNEAVLVTVAVVVGPVEQVVPAIYECNIAVAEAARTLLDPAQVDVEQVALDAGEAVPSLIVVVGPADGALQYDGFT